MERWTWWLRGAVAPGRGGRGARAGRHGYCRSWWTRMTWTGGRALVETTRPHSPPGQEGGRVPMWDMAGSCIVVSDGSSPWVLVSSIAGKRVDTVRFPLPQRTVAHDDEETTLRRRLG